MKLRDALAACVPASERQEERSDTSSSRARSSHRARPSSRRTRTAASVPRLPAVLVLAVAFWLASPSPALSQGTGALTGTVVDSSSAQPLVAAEVVVEGTTLRTTTDADGSYRIEQVPAGEHTVTASRLGYAEGSRTVTVAAGETLTADFRLRLTTVTIDELVVSSYSPTSRREPTGSSTMIDTTQIEDAPSQTMEGVLQGRAPGVSVRAPTGQPGGNLDVRIRGIGSISASNQPLYIIDGIPMATTREVGAGSLPSTSPLAAVNPRDIESIEVLKDPAAISIYGAQAANGVILITTRRGEEGATHWRLSSELGTLSSIDTWNLVGGPDWVRLHMESFGNRFSDLGRPRSAGEQQAVSLFGEPSQAATHDWQDAVLRDGAIRSADFSVSGGDGDTRFYLSASKDYQQGQVHRSDFDRTAFRTNLSHQASEKLSLQARLSYSDMAQEGEISSTCANCAFWFAPLQRPTIPVFDEDGSFNRQIRPIPYNIAFQVFNEDRIAETNHAIGSFAANYSVTPRLNIRALFGADYRTRRETSYRPPEQQLIGDFGQETYREVMNWSTNLLAEYSRTFADAHNVSALGGVEYRDEYSEVISAVGTGFPSGRFRTLDLAATPQSIGGFTGAFKVASAFGRVQYDYDNRYMLSASVRRDGSSRFGEDNQWGLFYSGSVGWELTREPFMDGVEFLDQLKLRASYGTTGNSGIGDFASRFLFGEGHPLNIGGNSYEGVSGLRPIQLGNDQLTWEEAETVNLGLDWTAWDGRLRGAIDVFRTDNENLLLDSFLPVDAGFNSIIENTGVVRNQGVEFSIGGVPVEADEFTWRSGFNLAYVDNEVRSLVGGVENLGDTIRVGHPIHVHWGAEWAGVNPADGRPMWYDENGDITYQVTSADMKVLGSPLPDVEGGWSNTFSYGPLQLGVFTQFSFGADVHAQQLQSLLDVSSTQGLSERVLDRWQEPGQVTDVPRPYISAAQPGTSPFTTFSDRFLFDGSYVRLKTASLSYRLPSGLVAPLGVSSARIYVRGNNLLTATEFPGIDPEVMAVDGGTYPNSRQFRVGLDLSLTSGGDSGGDEGAE